MRLRDLIKVLKETRSAIEMFMLKDEIVKHLEDYAKIKEKKKRGED